MTKRTVSFVIAITMLLGVVWTGAVPVFAESTFTASDDCIRILKAEEGFSATPYWDFTQYTVGYGTRCPADMVEYYTQNGITEEEAELLLRNHLAGVERDINVKVIDKYGLTMTQISSMPLCCSPTTAALLGHTKQAAPSITPSPKALPATI